MLLSDGLESLSSLSISDLSSVSIDSEIDVEGIDTGKDDTGEHGEDDVTQDIGDEESTKGTTSLSSSSVLHDHISDPSEEDADNLLGSPEEPGGETVNNEDTQSVSAQQVETELATLTEGRTSHDKAGSGEVVDEGHAFLNNPDHAADDSQNEALDHLHDHVVSLRSGELVSHVLEPSLQDHQDSQKQGSQSVGSEGSGPAPLPGESDSALRVQILLVLVSEVPLSASTTQDTSGDVTQESNTPEEHESLVVEVWFDTLLQGERASGLIIPLLWGIVGIGTFSVDGQTSESDETNIQEGNKELEDHRDETGGESSRGILQELRGVVEQADDEFDLLLEAAEDQEEGDNTQTEGASTSGNVGTGILTGTHEEDESTSHNHQTDWDEQGGSPDDHRDTDGQDGNPQETEVEDEDATEQEDISGSTNGHSISLSVIEVISGGSIAFVVQSNNGVHHIDTATTKFVLIASHDVLVGSSISIARDNPSSNKGGKETGREDDSEKAISALSLTEVLHWVTISELSLSVGLVVVKKWFFGRHLDIC